MRRDEATENAMTTRNGKLTMGVVGAAALAALGTAAVLGFPEFLTRRHLARLQEDPSLLVTEFLDSPAGGAKRRALERYLATEEGKDGLLISYRDLALESSTNLPSRWDTLRDTQYARWLLFWLDGSELKYRSYVDLPNWSFRGGGSSDRIASDAARALQSLQELIVAGGYEARPVLDAPGIEASVRSVDYFENDNLMGPEPWTTHVLVLSNKPVASGEPFRLRP